MEIWPRLLRRPQLMPWLLLGITGLFWWTVRDEGGNILYWWLALLAFVLFLVAGYRVPVLRLNPKLRLCLEVLAMVLLISVLIAQAPTKAGFLSPLYLLPVLTAALLLGPMLLGLLLLLILGGGLLVGVPLVALVALLIPTSLVALLMVTLGSALEEATRRNSALALEDELTGLYHFRAFTPLAEAALAGALREGTPTALVMLDVAQLGQINEHFGYAAGDRALSAVAAGIKRATRAGDLAARLGGDEFVILMPRCGQVAAEILATRIRHDVYGGTQELDHGLKKLAVTISTAVAPEEGQELRALLSKALQHMAKEKQANQLRGPESAPVQREFLP